MTTKKVSFELGRILSTPGALEAFKRAGEHPLAYLQMHAAGDWGIVGKEDWEANNQSVEDGTRILSAYRLKDGTKVWVITEADRSATTVLLPEEY